MAGSRLGKDSVSVAMLPRGLGPNCVGQALRGEERGDGDVGGSRWGRLVLGVAMLLLAKVQMMGRKPPCPSSAAVTHLPRVPLLDPQPLL